MGTMYLLGTSCLFLLERKEADFVPHAFSIKGILSLLIIGKLLYKEEIEKKELKKKEMCYHSSLGIWVDVHQAILVIKG